MGAICSFWGPSNETEGFQVLFAVLAVVSPPHKHWVFAASSRFVDSILSLAPDMKSCHFHYNVWDN